jgi:hypothetical protein
MKIKTIPRGQAVILEIATGVFAGLLCWHIFKAIVRALPGGEEDSSCEIKNCNNSTISSSSGSTGGRVVINGRVIEIRPDGKIVVNGKVVDVEE